MKDNLTFVDMTYHQYANSDPKLFEYRSIRELETSDQTFHRVHLTVDEIPKPLIPEKCWIESVGLVLVFNEEGVNYSVNPTEEIKEEDKKRILEIYHEGDNNLWYVYPGEPFKGTSSHPELLRIRSQHNECRYTLVVVPK